MSPFLTTSGINSLIKETLEHFIQHEIATWK